MGHGLIILLQPGHVGGQPVIQPPPFSPKGGAVADGFTALITSFWEALAHQAEPGLASRPTASGALVLTAGRLGPPNNGLT